MSKFRYSRSLETHTKPIRCLCRIDGCPQLPYDDGFPPMMSGSFDNTAVVWSGADYRDRMVLTGPTRCVCVVAYLPPYASKDGKIHFYKLATATPCQVLNGHTQQITWLDCARDGIFASASIDCTAVVWKDFKQIFTLNGHSKPVWSVLILSSDRFVTGSFDKTIKIWQNDQCIQTLLGHTDAIRSMVAFGYDGEHDDESMDDGSHRQPAWLLSGSNDQTIRLWDLKSGRQLRVFTGSEHFVFSVDVLPDGHRFISSGEDGALRIWSLEQESPLETIVQPETTIWSCCALANGDVAVGGESPTIRIFTEAPPRSATEQDIAAFEDQVKTARTKSSATPSNDDLSEVMTSRAVLERDGTKDGQCIVVPSACGTRAEAYHWDAASLRWNKIGIVSGKDDSQYKNGQVGPDGKAYCDGKWYDFVVPVEDELEADSQRRNEALKRYLCYNNGDNPYEVTDAFMIKYDLYQADIRQQVLDFVMKNMSYDEKTQSSEPPTNGVTDFAPSTVQFRFDSRQQMDKMFEVLKRFQMEVEENNPTLRCPLENMVGQYRSILHDELVSEKDFVEAVGNLLSVLQNWPAEKTTPAIDLFRLVSLVPGFERCLSMEQFASIPKVLARLWQYGAPAKSRAVAFRCMTNLVAVLGQGHLDYLTVVVDYATPLLASDPTDGAARFDVNSQTAFATMLLNFAVAKIDVNRQRPNDTTAYSSVLLDVYGKTLDRIVRPGGSFDFNALQVLFQGIGTVIVLDSGNAFGLEVLASAHSLDIGMKISAVLMLPSYANIGHHDKLESTADQLVKLFS